MNFMSSSEFCFRACKRSNTQAEQLCQHIYDVLGCAFNMPSLTGYADGFDSCDGDSAEPPGLYNGTSTFWQGAKTTPLPHPPAASSNCEVAPSPTSGGKQKFKLSQPKHTKKSRKSSTATPSATAATTTNAQLALATPAAGASNYPFTTGAKSMSPSSASQLVLPVFVAGAAALLAAAFTL